MAYDHSDKIGNQGDLVKHYALYLCLKTLLEKHPDDTPFVYAESHAGRAEYVLPEGGGWKNGINAFSTRPQITSERKIRACHGKPALPDLGEFDEIFIGRELKTGMKYLGSTGIAFRLLRGGNSPLRQHGQRFIMKIWEQSLPAVEDLTRYYHPCMPAHASSNPPPIQLVEINPGDGFAGVRAAGTLSFVLIDPPSVNDAGKVLKLIARLQGNNTPYLCWMPRTSYERKDSRKSADFRSRVESSGGVCHGIQWPPMTATCFGCWLAGSQSLDDAIKQACDEIRGLMSWA